MPAYEVQRSIAIQALAEKVFATLADFHTWATWSPWLCADQHARVKVSPDSRSVGSVYDWSGEIVGQGQIEHTRLEPPTRIDQELRFLKPFRSTSQVSFAIQPAEEGARLTWIMRGALPWFMFWMRSQMAVYIGMDFERGLQMIKEFVETGAVLSQTQVAGVQPVGPLEVWGVRRACTLDDVGSSMEQAFGDVDRLFTQHGLPTGGAAVSVYQRFDFASRQCDYTAGFVVPASSSPPAPLVGHSIPAIRALLVQHTGSYLHLGNAWSAAYQYARAKKLKQSKLPAFEIYRNDPGETAPADLLTDVYLPLK